MAPTFRKPMTDEDSDRSRGFSPRTIPEQVAEELGADIITGRRKAGERLVDAREVPVRSLHDHVSRHLVVPGVREVVHVGRRRM